MARRRRIPSTDSQSTPEYPTLREHLTSRRRFLEIAGATIAASGLGAACDRGLGAGSDPDASTPQPDGSAPPPDGSVPPDASHPPVPGGEREPHYYTLRLPAQDSASAYLIDDGYAAFYVIAATYDEQSYEALAADLQQAVDRCRSTIEEYTYDELVTSQGVAAAEDDIVASLDVLCQELNNHTYPTMEGVTLYLTMLEPSTDILGDMAEPSYP
ncbi:hypothetical protein ACFL51_01470 [Myxococcota bacterium]